MTLHEYRAGTVAIANVRNRGELRITRYDGGWAEIDDPNWIWDDVRNAGAVTNIRPLPVIDFGHGTDPTDTAIDMLRRIAVKAQSALEAEFLNWLANEIEICVAPPLEPVPDEVPAHIAAAVLRQEAKRTLRDTSIRGMKRLDITEHLRLRADEIEGKR